MGRAAPSSKGSPPSTHAKRRGGKIFDQATLDKRGFSYEEVKKRNPRIIYCSLTGFGSEGPSREKPGQDLLLQSLSGLAMLSGRASDPPVLIGTAIVDQHAATLGALGVVAALLRRERTGLGCKVDSNLLSAGLDLQIEPVNYHLNGAKLYDRSASGISSRFHQAPYGVFRTSDGWLTLSLADGHTLAKAFEDPKFRPPDLNEFAMTLVRRSSAVRCRGRASRCC